MAVESFHPAVARWFARLGEPTPAQREGWRHIREGRHTLIAAPTGSGKTLAGFLWAIDSLVRRGPNLRDETRVLYVSPLRALSYDVQKNLQKPLSEIRDLDPFVPVLRVLVRTGDTTAPERAAMARRPPHILVTTPESLYLLLTSESGRRILHTVRTVIVDEIHALFRDKRGSHLALSLERLEALAGPFQRIGLSATARPIDEIARFLTGDRPALRTLPDGTAALSEGGAGRECAIVDAGHRRDMDLAIEIPRSPLGAVCSHDLWEEIYDRMAELAQSHRTTLVFVNTRKLAERLSARLSKRLGEDRVACHHGSLSKARRLDAEERLKTGRLRALVATASLELGIDIGDVDLAIQVGSPRSIATFLQRMGRAGHGVGRTPRGRVFPLTLDELVEAAALLRAVRRGELDRLQAPEKPLDILAQQIVAECVSGEQSEDALFDRFRRAWPYRGLTREEFDRVVALHSQGRGALLHRDGVGRRLMATRRARLAALLSGGAIPDSADYDVVLEPEGVRVGSVHEEFATEADVADIFQLGMSSWRIVKVEPGIVRVADASGRPPTLPFWRGEAPARTRELSAEVSRLRQECTGTEWLVRECGVPEGAARQIADYLEGVRRSLGEVPTQERVIAERFFDEAGGMQLAIHAPFGGRINRAWGLALRKRFCVGFGFELQAAANEEGILISLGPQHSFPLEEVFSFLHPNTARDVLVQALLPQPLFRTRWRWNVTRALLVERMRSGRRVPPALLRMRAEDELARAFPQALACPETLPPGPVEVPMEHPLVRQTVHDALTEAMDVEGFLEVLRGIREGRIETRAVDVSQPSPAALGILAVQPYAFLDDGEIAGRRTQAVRPPVAVADDGAGELDPEAVARVREEAWPRPESAEEVHEALSWMGFVTVEEGRPWAAWLEELRAAGRVVREGDRWFAVEASRDPKEIWRGRLEALGPVESDDPALRELEGEGAAMRCRLEGRPHWCHRRLLARIRSYMRDRLRRESEPATAAEFLRFLARWQHVDEEDRLEGPAGVREAVRQLAGFEAPAAAWERSILPARVRGYRREWLDQLTMTGEVAWGRLWSSGRSAIRATPICLLPREEIDSWLGLSSPPDVSALSTHAREIHDALASRGAQFPQDLLRATGQLPAYLDRGLAELVAAGAATCDSFGALRRLLARPSKRAGPGGTGRWSLFRSKPAPTPPVEFVAAAMLRRTGVVFRRTIERERQPLPWRDLARAYRSMELRGEVRGGRFVAGFSGEQYALPGAVELLRRVRRRGEPREVQVSASDPLNFRGILTPDPRVPISHRGPVSVFGSA